MQKIAVLIGTAAFTLALLVPPWHLFVPSYGLNGDVFHFILTTSKAGTALEIIEMSIDWQSWAVLLAGITAITYAVSWLLAPQKT